MRKIETDKDDTQWTEYLELTDEQRIEQQEKYAFIHENIDFLGLFVNVNWL